MCLYGCARENVSTHDVHVEARGLCQVSSSTTLHLSFGDKALVVPGAHWFGQTGCQRVSGTCLCLQVSVPCTASTLAIEPSPKSESLDLILFICMCVQYVCVVCMFACGGGVDVMLLSTLFTEAIPHLISNSPVLSAQLARLPWRSTVSLVPGITGRLLLCLAFVCVGDRSGELQSSSYDRHPLNNLPRLLFFQIYVYVCMCACKGLFAVHVPRSPQRSEGIRSSRTK